MPTIKINPATGRPIAFVAPQNSRVNRTTSGESGFGFKPLFSSYSNLKEAPTIFGSSFSEDDSPVKDDPFVGAIATAVGQLANALPQLGVGRRKRVKEAQALADIETKKAQELADINKSVYETQTKSGDKQDMKLIVIGGTILFLIVVVFVALRN